MFHEPSPPLGPTHLPSGNAPPTPPHNNDALDDIYGSAPSSPLLPSTSRNPLPPSISARRGAPAEEILSDLPSRQRALDTDAYREGLSIAKGQYVQEGFDEGYALGAELGLLVGRILGVLRGVVVAMGEGDEEVRALLGEATRELRIEVLLGREWVDEGGVWKWDVEGEEGGKRGEVTFREVARGHPVVRGWVGRVRERVEGLGRRGWGCEGMLGV